MTLPPLPEKVQIDKHESGYVIRGYTTDQMKAYAQAAQQARQPLSDEELESMWEADMTSNDDHHSLYFFKVVARAVEREHGIGSKA